MSFAEIPNFFKASEIWGEKDNKASFYVWSTSPSFFLLRVFSYPGSSLCLVFIFNNPFPTSTSSASTALSAHPVESSSNFFARHTNHPSSGRWPSVLHSCWPARLGCLEIPSCHTSLPVCAHCLCSAWSALTLKVKFKCHSLLHPPPYRKIVLCCSHRCELSFPSYHLS